MTSNADANSDRRGQGVGALLREARMAQNLGVGDVARQLKLSLGQVEALEAGDFQRLPGPVFVRGFVRNYARLLRLDAEPLLEAVAASLPREEPLSPAPPSQDIPFPTAAPRPWRAYAAGLVAVVVALAAYEYFPTASESTATEAVATPGVPAGQSPQPADTVGVPARAGTPESSPSAPADLVAGGGMPLKAAGPITAAPAQQSGASAGGAQGTESATQLAASAAATLDAPPAVARAAARDEEPAPGPGERQVHMVFDQASWVEIRDRSGKAIFSQLNPRGTEQRVNGRPPLAVVVGNAHGVRLTYDERPINLSLHTKVDVARLTLQ